MTITYPEAIKRALKKNSAKPKRIPKLTTQAPSLLKWKNLLIQIGIILFLGGVSSSFAAWFGILVFVIGGIAIILQVRWQIRTYLVREKAYQVRVASYLRALEAYGISEVNSESSNLLATVLQQYQFIYQLSSKILPDYLVEFDLLLKQKLSERVHYKVSIPLSEAGFELDWAYIDPDLNLHIAILIFDPKYSIAQQLLLQMGWILLEFSETDLASEPGKSVEKVCQTVALFKINNGVLTQD
jgi:hypothetical protein